MENQALQHAHFSRLPLGQKVRVGAVCGAISLVVMVLTALAVHCYHRRRGSARAQHARDAEAARASEVQLSAAQLAASQARTQDLELELAAAQARTSTLQGQLAELERRCHGFYEELRQERQKAKQERDMLKEGQQTSYAMYKEAVREVEFLKGLLALQVEPRREGDELPGPDVHAPPSEPPMVAAAPPALPAEVDE